MNQQQLQEFFKQSAFAARQARQNANTLSELQQGYGKLEQLLSKLQVESRYGDPGIQRVENIPGRRIPFDMLVDIAIPAGAVAPRKGTITINQEGPFVAVARSFSLTSAYQVVRTDPDTEVVTRFNGRSYGRFRTVHSAWDLNDGHPIVTAYQQDAFPGAGAPHIVSPSNQSSFRSMCGDFRVNFIEAGSSFPRQNLDVPSTQWTKSINEPWELGALDVFERGEVLQFTLQALHQNNAAAGNVSAFAAGNALYPFIEGQYDCVEGISDPVVADVTTDPIVRQPNAVATIGFHGFLIVQQPGIPR